MNDSSKMRIKVKFEQAQALLVELRIASVCLSNAVSRECNKEQIEAKITEAKKLIQDAILQ